MNISTSNIYCHQRQAVHKRALWFLNKIDIYCLCPREFPCGLYEYHISFAETPYDVDTAIISIFRRDAKAKKKLNDMITAGKWQSQDSKPLNHYAFL